jgi:DNA invertase Pin-like site-specific DNA recombinase
VVHDLDQRGVGFKVLSGTPIGTSTAARKLDFAIFAGLAKFERSLIAGRTNAGLMAARGWGRTGGRKPKMTKAKLRLAQSAMANRDTKAGELCKELGITRQTLYRFAGPNGELRADGAQLLQRNGQHPALEGARDRQSSLERPRELVSD